MERGKLSLAVTVTALLALLVLVASCGGDDDEAAGDGPAAAEASGEPIVVGASADISGPVAATYSPIFEGFRVYVEWVNAQGGIDGHPIDLLVRDHKSDPALVASDIRFFNERNTTAVFYAGPSSTLASYVEAMGDAPTLYGNACYPPAPPPEPAENFFCVGVSPLTDAVAIVDLLFEHTGGQDLKVGLVSEDIPGCRVVHDTLIRADLEERGAEVVGFEVVPVTVTNMEPTARKLQQAGANAIVHYCLSEQMVGLGQALGRIGWDGTYLAAGNIPGMIDGVADAKSESFYAFDWFSLPDESVPVWQDIMAAAEAHGANFPIVDLRWGWSIGIAFEQALRECGFPCERDALIEVMNNLTVDDEKFLQLFGSPLQWSPDNHTSPAKAYQLDQWSEEEGEVVPILDDWVSVEETGMGGE
jgi:ABC-type branched-subunit amino acid transport system substrate-binding protein